MVEATWRKYSAILYFNSLFTYYGKYNLKYRENWLSLFSFQEPVFSPHSVICVRIFVTIGIQKRCNVPVNCLCINCVPTVCQMPVYQHQHNHHISHHHHRYLDGSGLTCGGVIVGKSLDQLSQYISRCGRGDPFPLNGQDEDFGKFWKKLGLRRPTAEKTLAGSSGDDQFASRFSAVEQ